MNQAEKLAFQREEDVDTAMYFGSDQTDDHIIGLETRDALITKGVPCDPVVLVAIQHP